MCRLEDEKHMEFMGPFPSRLLAIRQERNTYLAIITLLFP
jgi:hypothetical protein